MAKKNSDQPASVTTSDEGIPYTVSGEEVTNTSTDIVDKKRRELRVNGKPYHHTGDNALGQWVYRSDK